MDSTSAGTSISLSLGIEFVSLTEGVDTSTPAGKMVFTVLGAVAELERGLICERVRAGLRNAKAKGKKLGRPSKNLDTKTILALKAQGLPLRAIAKHRGGSELFIAWFLRKRILERGCRWVISG